MIPSYEELLNITKYMIKANQYLTLTCMKKQQQRDL